MTLEKVDEIMERTKFNERELNVKKANKNGVTSKWKIFVTYHILENNSLRNNIIMLLRNLNYFGGIALEKNKRLTETRILKKNKKYIDTENKYVCFSGTYEIKGIKNALNLVLPSNTRFEAIAKHTSGKSVLAKEKYWKRVVKILKCTNC